MIPVTRSSMPPFEEYCEEIRKLWESRWLTNMGEEHELLERKLGSFLCCPETVLFTNGHLALENALACFGFPEGSEVITTPFTFASTTHAIVRNRLVPVFCDVDPSDYTIDPEKMEALVTEKTVAAVPVHVYGNFCRVDRIAEIARRHGLRVIYDAAHAFGETLSGKTAAQFGDAVMYSFHATKSFNTIEGGAVCTADPDMAQTLRDMKNFGIRNAESCVYPGGNAKMNEFQAAMGICNLRHFAEEIGKRKEAALRYRERLSGHDGLRLCPPQEGVVSNYTYMPVIFPEMPGEQPPAGNSAGGAEETLRPDAAGSRAREHRRDRIARLLSDHGIFARKYFYPLTSAFECYRGLPGAGAEKTPVAAWLADRVLTLPLYADLALSDVDRICDLLLEETF